MKKSNLLVGIGYIVVGAAFLLLALLFNGGTSSLFFGFAGAGIGVGIMMIARYFYWSKSENKGRYQEKLENEMIESHDELKIKLRDKSGRYAYVFGLVITTISIVVFFILGELQIVNNSRVIVIYLSAYLLFQFICGIVIYNHLLKIY